MKLHFFKRVVKGLLSGGLLYLVYRYFARLWRPCLGKLKKLIVKSLASRFPKLREKILDKSLSKTGGIPIMSLLRLHLDDIYLKSGKGGVVNWVSKYNESPSQFYLNLACFQLLVSKEPVLAAHYGYAALHGNSESHRQVVWLAEQMAKVLKRMGKLTEAVDFLNRYRSEVNKGLLATINDDIALLNGGFQFKTCDLHTSMDSITTGDHVLYLAHYSLPYVTNGYVARTHGLLKALVDKGQQLECLTRLGFPYDNGMKILGVKSEHSLDGVSYSHMPSFDSGYNISPMHEYLQKYTQAVVDFLLTKRPSVIHCASNFISGLAGTTAAKVLGIPSIYEVRGLWEFTRASRDPDWMGSDHFNMMARLETQAANQADLVFTLTEGLREELISRGVDAAKIKLLPNGVDVDRFQPLSRSTELEKQLKLAGCVVLGYVGSVVDYEGLDDLLRALAILKKSGLYPCKALIVGDGNALKSLKALAKTLDVEDSVCFTGKVPHDQVEKYYSLIDVAVFPRKPLPVCELVSPLKPFEAMAMEKVIVVSSVKALTEIVQQSGVGFVFDKGSPESLADVLSNVLTEKENFHCIGRLSREWVKAERSWDSLANDVKLEYSRLMEVVASKRRTPA